MAGNGVLSGRFRREGELQPGEVSVVTSPGARAAAWVVKVKSLSSYNFYNVRSVIVGDAGSFPVEIGVEKKAVNVAEPFDQQGQIEAGTYAIMFKVGDKYVFYAAV